jgi:hypothetical protein
VLHQALRKIISVLEKLGVPYALIGGLALAFYEIIRATEDLDLLVLISPPDMARLAQQIEAYGLTARTRKGSPGDPIMGVIVKGELQRCLKFMVENC